MVLLGVLKIIGLTKKEMLFEHYSMLLVKGNLTIGLSKVQEKLVWIL